MQQLFAPFTAYTSSSGAPAASNAAITTMTLTGAGAGLVAVAAGAPAGPPPNDPPTPFATTEGAAPGTGAGAASNAAGDGDTVAETQEFIRRCIAAQRAIAALLNSFPGLITLCGDPLLYPTVISTLRFTDNKHARVRTGSGKLRRILEVTGLILRMQRCSALARSAPSLICSSQCFACRFGSARPSSASCLCPPRSASTSSGWSPGPALAAIYPALAP